jgi:hypothetical protein
MQHAIQIAALVNDVGNKYGWLFMKQRDAVENLSKAAATKDPPSLVEQLVLGAISVALSSATGGIAGLVMAKLKDQISEKAFDAVKSVVSNSMSALVQGGFDKAKEAHGEATTGLDAFFEGQMNALEKAAELAQTTAVNALAIPSAPGADLMAQLQQTVAGLDQIDEDTIRDKQWNASLSAWCTYQAQAPRGVYQDGDQAGTNLGASLAGGAGVLELEATFDGYRIARITSAHMDGLNEALRASIASQPIGDMKIPLIVRCAYGTIGENETGTVWVGDDPFVEGFVLRVTQGQSEQADPADQQRLLYVGARLLIDDVKQLRLIDSGVTLTS